LFGGHSSDDTRSENGQIENATTGKLPASATVPLLTSEILGRIDHLVSAAGSGAKLLLYIAKNSSDGFGPLKSVLGGICAIFDQYEVRPEKPVFRVGWSLHASAENTCCEEEDRGGPLSGGRGGRVVRHPNER
jgi:hypothetical protein